MNRTTYLIEPIDPIPWDLFEENKIATAIDLNKNMSNLTDFSLHSHNFWVYFVYTMLQSIPILFTNICLKKLVCSSCATDGKVLRLG